MDARIAQLSRIVEDTGDPACVYCGKPCNPVVVVMSEPGQPIHQPCLVKRANGIAPSAKKVTRITPKK